MGSIPAEFREISLEYFFELPLVAAIKAQALAAERTMDFIKEMGLKPRAFMSGESVAELDEVRQVMTLNEAVCKGCSGRNAIYPSEAATMKHYRDRQEYTQIEALTGIRLPIGMEVVKQWKIWMFTKN